MDASGTRTTLYLHPDNAGGLGFEAETAPNGSLSQRHYLSVGGRTIGVLVTTAALPALTASQMAPAVLATTTAVKLEYWHTDHLGSLAATTDHLGAVTARYAYDPFGKRRLTNGQYDAFGTLIVDWSPNLNRGTDRGFTGHEMLDDIGLVHMNGRLYDARIGRFLSTDPHVTQPQVLQNYDRYSYLLNNPLNATDPTGFCGDVGPQSRECPVRQNMIDRELREIDFKLKSGWQITFFNGPGWLSGPGSVSQDAASASPTMTANGGGADGTGSYQFRTFLGGFFSAFSLDAKGSPSEGGEEQSWWSQCEAEGRCGTRVKANGGDEVFAPRHYSHVGDLARSNEQAFAEGRAPAGFLNWNSAFAEFYSRQLEYMPTPSAAGLSVINVVGKATMKYATKAVGKYEVGTWDTLKQQSAAGDGLDIHHAMQKHPAGQVVTGYDAATGPSIALPRAEHLQIPTMQGAYGGSARDLLAKDIRDLRNYTNAPNSSLQQLIDLNKQMYPGSF